MNILLAMLMATAPITVEEHEYIFTIAQAACPLGADRVIEVAAKLPDQHALLLVNFCVLYSQGRISAAKEIEEGAADGPTS
jgi:hypothetical protein